MSTQRESFVKNLKEMKRIYDEMVPYLSNIDMAENMMIWDKEAEMAKLNSLKQENEMLKVANDRAKEDNAALLDKGRSKYKEMEDNYARKLAELSAEISIKRSELEKLNGDIYKLTQSPLGLEVAKKGK
jgi:hypothetical protein